MIGAGFVRNKVWDHLHGFSNDEVQTADIDLIYFDPATPDEEREKIYDRRLRDLCAVKWSCKNQARMHNATVNKANRSAPYASTTDALARWVETSTCVAVTLRGGNLALIAPHGIDDLARLVVRQNPLFEGSTEDFLARVTQKRWLEKWPSLRMAPT
jgi:hypothetical protein